MSNSTIIRSPSLIVRKLDSVTGDPLKGAKFHIGYASNKTFTGEINDLGDYFTDENGQVQLDKVQDGWYKVTELEAPAGYSIKQPATQEAYIKAGTSKTFTFENVPLSAIVIKKVDADSGKPLEGACRYGIIYSSKFIAFTALYKPIFQPKIKNFNILAAGNPNSKPYILQHICNNERF